MKRAIMAFLGAVLTTVALAAAASAAEQVSYGPHAGMLGMGILLGDPTSGSLKYWLDDVHAIDAGVGVSDNLVLHADYMYHGWDLFPQPTRGRLAAYISVGGRLEFEDQTDFGIRLVPGLSYWPKISRPAELFFELGPVLRLTNGVRGTVDGGFGFRFYFEPHRA